MEFEAEHNVVEHRFRQCEQKTGHATGGGLWRGFATVIGYCNGKSSCANDTASIVTVDGRETKDVQHQ